MRVGVDVIDMDINMTKDKVLVVTHDLTLNPDLTKDENGNWVTAKTPIKDLTLDQVKKHTVGYIKPNSATAKMYPNHIGMDNVHMPTLEEVINYVKSNVGSRVRLQIEIKTNPYDPNASWTAEEMAEALNKVLVKTDMTDNVEVQSFEWQALVDLQKLNPKAGGTAAGFTGLFGYFLGTVGAQAVIGIIATMLGWDAVFIFLLGSCVIATALLAICWNLSAKKH